MSHTLRLGVMVSCALFLVLGIAVSVIAPIYQITSRIK